MAKRSVEYTQKRPDGSEVTKTLTDVNIAADEVTIASFVGAVSDLSENTLSAITNVTTNNLTNLCEGLESGLLTYDNTGTKTRYSLTASGEYEFTDSNIQIYGGDYPATITTSGDYVTLRTGKAVNTKQDDVVYNHGNNCKISLCAGDDSIYNTGNNVTIDGGRGDDTIYNTGNYVYIYSNTDDDTIYNTGDYVTINGREGDDSIYNTGDYVSINGFSDNDTIHNTGDYVSIDGSQHHKNITCDGNNCYIKINNATDLIDNGSNNTIETSSIWYVRTGEVFNNTLPGISIVGGDGDNSIYNTGDYVSIYGGTGDDSIYNTGDYVSISGYSGNDTITNTGSNVTIYGVLSNYSIDNTGASNTTFSYGWNNNSCTITGFNQASDLIYCNTSGATISFEKQNFDVLVNMEGSGTNNIWLKNITSGQIRYKPYASTIQTVQVADIPEHVDDTDDTENTGD